MQVHFFKAKLTSNEDQTFFCSLKQTTRVGFVDAGEENTDEIVELNDVFFLEENSTKQAAILDVGCPKSLVGRNWLNKYLMWKNLNMKHLKKRQCSQKFNIFPWTDIKSKPIFGIPFAKGKVMK